MNNYIVKVNCKAISQVRSKDSDKVLGYIFFDEDTEGKLHVHGELSGLPPGIHAFHVHTSSDPRKCCDSLGSHYNPFNKPHGGRVLTDSYGYPIKDSKGNEIINQTRHFGDFGNIEVKSDGTAKFSFVDTVAKISGPHSIIGRSVVIHADPDDLGKGGYPDSLTTGHAGSRIAWGSIGYA
jgi:Cu-Zn family superoxide dismutase